MVLENALERLFSRKPECVYIYSLEDEEEKRGGATKGSSQEGTFLSGVVGSP